MEALEPRLVMSTVWVPQGPSPALLGQTQGLTSPYGPNPVAGAVAAIAPSLTDPNVVYIGAVNGGVWRTGNATSTTPFWVPLTDQSLPALSITSLAVSPLNPLVLYAGTGAGSSYLGDGVPGYGIARTTDGGATWAVLSSDMFTGRNVIRVVPTSRTGTQGQVVLAATFTDFGGVYRSVNSGATFERVSGQSGLPDSGVTDLIADPKIPGRFYASVTTSSGAAFGEEGVYESDDWGVSWQLTPGSGLAGLDGSDRILLAVGSVARSQGVTGHTSTAAVSETLYAAVTDYFGTLTGVFRSDDAGANWLDLGIPSPTVFPAGRAGIYGAIAVDPTDPNVVYLSGDRQDAPFPNAVGATNYTANIVRGVSTPVDAASWEPVVSDGANGTAPHSDSRALAFDAAGNLLEADAGGVARLSTPNDPGARAWTSLNGNLGITEVHSVGYDALSHVIIAGSVDVGTSYQPAAGSPVWLQLLQGEGANVAVDANQIAHPGLSIRYSSFPGLQLFNRTYWNASGAMVGTYDPVKLNIVAGLGAPFPLTLIDFSVQPYTPFAINHINPNRMMIGTSFLYESFDRGDSLVNLGYTNFYVGDGLGGSPIDYGGMLNNVPNPDIFYAGAGSTVKYRATLNSPVVTLAGYHGGVVRSVVMNPQNDTQVFVLDADNHVWASSNSGTTWTDLTLNLGKLTTSARTLEMFSPDRTTKNAVLVVGGAGGVWQLPRPGSAGGAWTPVGTGLPHAIVDDLQYDITSNLLVAGTLGRGVWTISNFFRGGTVTTTTAGLESTGTSTYKAPATAQPLIALPVQPVTSPAAVTTGLATVKGPATTTLLSLAAPRKPVNQPTPAIDRLHGLS